MIVRSWQGIVKPEHRDEYLEYIKETGGGEYEQSPGCLSWLLITRLIGDETAWRGDGGRCEVTAISMWESEEALQSFTGPDINQMVLYAEDKRYLRETPTLTHYVVAHIRTSTGQ